MSHILRFCYLLGRFSFVVSMTLQDESFLRPHRGSWEGVRRCMANMDEVKHYLRVHA